MITKSVKRPATPIESSLYAALQNASFHLDYCGYGDRWERECAEEQGLRKVISAALNQAELETDVTP